MDTAKEEARSQMELLKLALERIRKEIAAIKYQFCSRQNHYWHKNWQESKEQVGLFAVTHYSCYLCNVWAPLKTDGMRCHICNEELPPNYHASEEDIASCSYCGYNNTMNPRGVPIRNIPKVNNIYTASLD